MSGGERFRSGKAAGRSKHFWGSPIRNWPPFGRYLKTYVDHMHLARLVRMPPKAP